MADRKIPIHVSVSNFSVNRRIAWPKRKVHSPKNNSYQFMKTKVKRPPFPSGEGSGVGSLFQARIFCAGQRQKNGGQKNSDSCFCLQFFCQPPDCLAQAKSA